jgi:hypothetical protein
VSTPGLSEIRKMDGTSLRPPICTYNVGARCVESYLVLIAPGADFVLSYSSRRRPKEYCPYSCDSLVLHVRKYMSISVQREGRAGMSELLRDNFWRYYGSQCDCGRRVPQVVKPDSWQTGEVKY